MSFPWEYRWVYSSDRCCDCGKGQGEIDNYAFAAFIFGSQYSVDEGHRILEALRPHYCYFQHLAVGVLGIRGDGEDWSMARFMLEHIRNGAMYFSLCDGCRQGADTVQEWIAWQESLTLAARYELESWQHGK